MYCISIYEQHKKPDPFRDKFPLIAEVSRLPLSKPMSQTDGRENNQTCLIVGECIVSSVPITIDFLLLLNLGIA
jgi:hypothetical protein